MSHTFPKFRCHKVVGAAPIIENTHTTITVSFGDGSTADFKLADIDTRGFGNDVLGKVLVQDDNRLYVCDTDYFVAHHGQYESVRLANTVAKLIEDAFVKAAKTFNLTDAEFIEKFYGLLKELTKKCPDLNYHEFWYETQIDEGKFVTKFNLDGAIHTVKFTPHREAAVASRADAIVAAANKGELTI